MEPEETHFVPCEAQDYDSEFRLDPLTERWSLVAEGRGERPANVGAQAPSERARDVAGDDLDPDCVFCPGNERFTTATSSAVVLRDPSSDGQTPDEYDVVTKEMDDEVQRKTWSARAFENKYPAFRISRRLAPSAPFDEVRRRFRAGELPPSQRFFQSVDAIGRHEVIVDVRRHVRGWGEASPLEICLAFRLIQSRLRELRASGRFAYAFFFKNVGVNAGASQSHSHCQLTANVTIPDDVLFQLERVAHYEKNRRLAGERDSFWDALLRAELDEGKRVVVADDSFVLYCPYASRFPVQSEICPRFDGAFEDYGAKELDTLATTARAAILALQTAYEKRSPNDASRVDYNVVMTNGPYNVPSELEDAASVFRPRLTILPSLVKKAGFEYGSGIDINPVSPETAAAWLREYFEK